MIVSGPMALPRPRPDMILVHGSDNAPQQKIIVSAGQVYVLPGAAAGGAPDETVIQVRSLKMA